MARFSAPLQIKEHELSRFRRTTEALGASLSLPLIRRDLQSSQATAPLSPPSRTPLIYTDRPAALRDPQIKTSLTTLSRPVPIHPITAISIPGLDKKQTPAVCAAAPNHQGFVPASVVIAFGLLSAETQLTSNMFTHAARHGDPMPHVLLSDRPFTRIRYRTYLSERDCYTLSRACFETRPPGDRMENAYR